MKVSVKNLKDHLSTYLKQAQRGEEVIITFHDKPIATISPFCKPGMLTTSRREWLNNLKSLHQALGKLKSGSPLSESIIKQRKEERY